MEAIRTLDTEVLLSSYKKVRAQTHSLCVPLLPEDMIIQPITDVSPPKWHLGHTTWFFETFVLKPFCKGYKTFDDDFSFLFNSYYDSVGSRVKREKRGTLSRPAIDRVFQYRDYVDDKMIDFLEMNNISKKICEFVTLGLNHEEQHQELLLTDIKYILGKNPLYPAYQPSDDFRKTLSMNHIGEYSTIPEGFYDIGYRGKNFSYDNEKPVHRLHIPDFTIRNRLVTNKEYLEFMEAGGYRDFRFWLLEGWEMIKKNKIRSPLYWVNLDGQWHEYTLSGLHKLNPDNPVTHISFYEAEAYAQWSGNRLLTEFEWEAACHHLKPDSGKANLLETENYHPSPAYQGKNLLLGDTWEWTYSSYHPYPGYQKEDGALGEYNGKFMINQMVLRGGSCATPEEHIRPTYRNFFHPDKRWQFTGIRLAKNK